MSSQKSSSIDMIKKQYEYKKDYLDFKKTAFVGYFFLFGHFMVLFKNYAVEQKLKEIKKI